MQKVFCVNDNESIISGLHKMASIFSSFKLTFCWKLDGGGWMFKIMASKTIVKAIKINLKFIIMQYELLSLELEKVNRSCLQNKTIETDMKSILLFLKDEITEN